VIKEKTISSRLIYEGKILKLRVDTVQIPDGSESIREVVEHSDCVAVVVIDANDDVLLVRQFRQPAGKELIEIPAGCIEPGEDAMATVRRELQEEIGYLPERVELLGGFYSAPGYCSEYIYLYLATELIPSQLYAEDTDSIKLVRVSIKRILPLITSGSICDAKSIAGLLTFLKHQKKC
jgi:ADP-ribose pyrophosphatase